MLLHFLRQLGMVERNVMLGIGKSGQQRTATFPLVGRLAIGCRIGKSLVVENPIGIQSFDVALKTVELCVRIALSISYNSRMLDSMSPVVIPLAYMESIFSSMS